MVAPGTVMVIDHEGALQPSYHPYDKRVAGMVSGAGDYKPGIVLDTQQPYDGRLPITLLGKVYGKADASYGSIEIGNLMITSPTLGHAMMALDPRQAGGAISGSRPRRHVMPPSPGICIVGISAKYRSTQL